MIEWFSKAHAIEIARVSLAHLVIIAASLILWYTGKRLSK